MRPLFFAALAAVSLPALAQQPSTYSQGRPPYSTVEPREPQFSKPSSRPPVYGVAEPRLPGSSKPAPKPDGPCVIKPVMSDQDLANCGATPR